MSPRELQDPIEIKKSKNFLCVTFQSQNFYTKMSGTIAVRAGENKVWGVNTTVQLTGSVWAERGG